jgi:hypothetical protein
MPLSPPADRAPLHARDIALRGFERADGLFDIEATLADTKSYAFTTETRGEIRPGERLHGMAARMTVDADMRITRFEAAIDDSPYPTVCPGAAPNFARLEGLVIGPGFVRNAMQRVGGTGGCTHLRELLQQMATVAYQTMYPARARRAAATRAAGAPRPAPGLLNTCHGWSSASPVIRAGWPHLYTGGDTSEGVPSEAKARPLPAR